MMGVTEQLIFHIDCGWVVVVDKNGCCNNVHVIDGDERKNPLKPNVTQIAWRFVRMATS